MLQANNNIYNFSCYNHFFSQLNAQKNDNFSFKIEAIVPNVGNLRIKVTLLIAKLHPQINSRLELNRLCYIAILENI